MYNKCHTISIICVNYDYNCLRNFEDISDMHNIYLPGIHTYIYIYIFNINEI